MLTTISGDKGKPKQTCKPKPRHKVKRASPPIRSIYEDDSDEFTKLRELSPHPSNQYWVENGQGFAIKQTVSAVLIKLRAHGVYGFNRCVVTC